MLFSVLFYRVACRRESGCNSRFGCAHMSPTSEDSGGGTSGFMMKVHLRVLRCYMKVDNIKPELDPFVFSSRHAEILWASGRLQNLRCATGRPSSEMSRSFTDQVRRECFADVHRVLSSTVIELVLRPPVETGGDLPMLETIVADSGFFRIFAG